MSRPTLRQPPYANWRVLAPDGTEMFHCGHRRRRWYLSRGLAEPVEGRPECIRLTFRPAGPGNAGDAYYLTPKANVCVACGSPRRLTRHHVVPVCYRRHFPQRFKVGNYHDILLLCADCHTRYEDAAVGLKDEIGEEFGVSVHGTAERVFHERVRVLKAATALLRHGRAIPPDKAEALRRIVRAHCGRDPDAADLEAAGRIECRNPDFRTHGAAVVGRLATDADFDAFVKRWRGHFLAVMRPAHMPANWDPERPAHEHWHV